MKGDTMRRVLLLILCGMVVVGCGKPPSLSAFSEKTERAVKNFPPKEGTVTSELRSVMGSRVTFTGRKQKIGVNEVELSEIVDSDGLAVRVTAKLSSADTAIVARAENGSSVIVSGEIKHAYYAPQTNPPQLSVLLSGCELVR